MCSGQHQHRDGQQHDRPDDKAPTRMLRRQQPDGPGTEQNDAEAPQEEGAVAPAGRQAEQDTDQAGRHDRAGPPAQALHCGTNGARDWAVMVTGSIPRPPPHGRSITRGTATTPVPMPATRADIRSPGRSARAHGHTSGRGPDGAARPRDAAGRTVGDVGLLVDALGSGCRSAAA
jgi:hypothetical protein